VKKERKRNSTHNFDERQARRLRISKKQSEKGESRTFQLHGVKRKLPKLGYAPTLGGLM